MKKITAVVMILVTVFALMVPVFASANAAGIKEMWVNCSDGYRLNLRPEPDTRSGLITRLDCGTRLEILEDVGNGWVYISAGNGKLKGYVMSKFLVEKKPGKYEITERDDHFVAVQPFMVAAKALNDKTDRSVGLRTRPNKTANAIRRLTAGEQLQVIAKGQVWSKVLDPVTGKTGYAANDYLQII